MVQHFTNSRFNVHKFSVELEHQILGQGNIFGIKLQKNAEPNFYPHEVKFNFKRKI